MATSSYSTKIANLKTVGIKELKNNLSAYLRDVRRGFRIFVSDRTIVAELREPIIDSNVPGSVNPVLSEWVSSGVLSLPSTEKQRIAESYLRSKNGLSLELREQERGEADE